MVTVHGGGAEVSGSVEVLAAGPKSVASVSAASDGCEVKALSASEWIAGER